MGSLLWFKVVTESVLSKWLMSARTDFHIILFFSEWGLTFALFAR